MPKNNETDISRIAKDLVTLGGTPTVEENVDLTGCEFDEEGYAIVGEDNDRDQWVSEFAFDELTFEGVTRLMTGKFGPPSKVHPLKDGHGPINNWDIGKALVVHGGTDVSVYQDFTRRAR